MIANGDRVGESAGWLVMKLIWMPIYREGDGVAFAMLDGAHSFMLFIYIQGTSFLLAYRHSFVILTNN